MAYGKLLTPVEAGGSGASRVHLEEVVLIPIADGATSVNLYKTGSAHAMHPRAVPPLWIPALRDSKDFFSAGADRTFFYAFNTSKPPFDNVLVRYAFHMATDKREIGRFLAGGQTLARTVVPPFGGYAGPEAVRVEVGGRIQDVLSYDPEAARRLTEIAGVRKLVLNLTFPNRNRSKELGQILQKQWGANLGAQVNLFMADWTAWSRAVFSVSYQGVIESGDGASYGDPNTFFELFTGKTDGSGWSDPEFDRLVDNANAETDAATRMRKLAGCEGRLLRARPVLPMFFDTYNYLQKPFVRGMPPNMFGAPEFTTAWIDTKWRPA